MRCAACLAFGLALALASPALAGPAVGAETAERDDAWSTRLQGAQMRIDRARQRVAEATAAVSEARHRNRPRGEALAAIEQEQQQAEQELTRAEAELPALLEQARSEGVSPAVLMRFETEPAAASDG